MAGGFLKFLGDVGSLAVYSNISYFYHMTHKKNIFNIFKYGLLSHNYAHSKGIVKVDISDHDVNDRRTRKDPFYNKSLHDYVPFYINPKNPMLYVRKNEQDDILLIGVKPMKLLNRSFLITDGNAASDYTNFSDSATFLASLDWQVLKADYWNSFQDGKRKRCAEVLIPTSVPLTDIGEIVSNNNYSLGYARKAGEGYNINFVVRKEFYF